MAGTLALTRGRQRAGSKGQRGTGARSLYFLLFALRPGYLVDL